jgi:hypothetical protein
MTAKLSASTGTLMLVCAVAVLGRKLFEWGNMEPKAQLYFVFMLGYLLALAGSGWLYVACQKLIVGIIHTVLMLGIAGVGIGSGVMAYCNRGDIAGGSGPDANPVGPIIFLAVLAATVVGIIAAICAAGVIWHLVSRRTKRKAVAP